MYNIIEYSNRITFNKVQKSLRGKELKDCDSFLWLQASASESRTDVIGEYESLEEAEKNFRADFCVYAIDRKCIEILVRAIEHEDEESGCIETDNRGELSEEQLRRLQEILFCDCFDGDEVL